MPETTLRLATPEDAARLQPLVHRAYRGDTARKGWTHEADLLDGNRIDVDSVAAIVADPDQAVVMAERDGAPVGCVQVSGKGGGLAYLGMLSVEPELQGAGLGRKLVREAERVAVGRFGADRMEMTVIVQRAELIAWYERLGYVRTGETRPFPATDPRFGLPKRDDLAFTVLERCLT
ncbi:MAG: GNAT family N-acetyltransferase [Alphaproteobacteria bacterium]|nr:GNAT family N-acetyltransferase [Alphaproteobacteria bacterium]MBU1525781.1 GNAT family N-acetyltransferase [Alphaproteobacteria bacterium]MBU2117357.1 GNAT family N-acetyltransferase [Alphaproteobacteria bacterium]MBU2349843.1 GNAT family N-acetyltransferase [Alphaproteobacteria bacterium]MBU2383401.1 GNAT family N-acetyltransferase [Alphaproteobacteria bacterium]